MSRIKLTRVTEKTYWHHMSRGNDGMSIFRKEEDYRRFMDRVVVALSETAIELLAVSPMPNHYHCLLCGTGPHVARFAHRVKSPYAREYNDRRLRTGHLFQPRHKSKPVSFALAKYISAYINLNPETAGLGERTAPWRWTSLRAYLDPKHRPPWLKCEPILEAVGDYTAYLDSIRNWRQGPEVEANGDLSPEDLNYVNTVCRIFDRFLFDHSPDIQWRWKKARQLTLLYAAEHLNAPHLLVARALGFPRSTAYNVKRMRQAAENLLRGSPWLRAALDKVIIHMRHE